MIIRLPFRLHGAVTVSHTRTVMTALTDRFRRACNVTLQIFRSQNKLQRHPGACHQEPDAKENQRPRFVAADVTHGKAPNTVNLKEMERFIAIHPAPSKKELGPGVHLRI